MDCFCIRQIFTYYDHELLQYIKARWRFSIKEYFNCKNRISWIFTYILTKWLDSYLKMSLKDASANHFLLFIKFYITIILLFYVLLFILYNAFLCQETGGFLSFLLFCYEIYPELMQFQRYCVVLANWWINTHVSVWVLCWFFFIIFLYFIFFSSPIKSFLFQFLLGIICV